MPDQPASLKELFLTALAVPPADRAAWLDGACGPDAERRRQVELMLAAHDTPQSLLDRLAPPPEEPTGGFAGPATEHGAALESEGSVIGGRYKLLEVLGEGGMGVVWMAQQTEPVKRLVALKLIKAGMDSRQVLARFEAERQALALMDHPHIAKVLDAGAAETGRPYFVMELVKGVPITRYCDEQRLTPQQRLELFLPVCQAVQHAHQKGIIHRDIKPSNVLVALYDGRPAPKVIDFGIAKATGQTLTDKTLVTGFGTVVGTLEYMSPEQAELNQLDVDTRSDVYSLGVLLYELLTGSTPLQKKRLREVAMLEILRLIREEDPPKPSERLSATDELPAVAAKRGLEPKKLSGQLRGELDWVVMRALEKDRARRYQTANALAVDVQCYLADEPVQACPPSAGYRLRKFVRRNRGAVLAALALFLMLAAGVTGVTIGLVRALAAERQTRAERDDKEEARRQTRQALDTMTDEVMEDLLGKQVQLTEQHREFLRKVLAYHAAFAAATGDDPESRHGRARAAFRVGRIRFALGEFKDAEAAYQDALALQEELAAEFPEWVECRQELAETNTRRGHLLSATGRPAKAEAAYRDALAVHARLAADFTDRPEYREEVARSHINLGVLYRTSGQLEKAEAAYRDALAIREGLAASPGQPEFLRRLADTHYLLGELHSAADRPKESVAAYQAALDLRKKLPSNGPQQAADGEETALNHIQLGVMLKATGRRVEAASAFREAMTLLTRLTAEFSTRTNPKHMMTMVYQQQGLLLGDAHKKPEALKVYRLAVGVGNRLVAEFPERIDFLQSLAISQFSLANLLRDLGQTKEAEAVYRETLPLFKQLAAAPTIRTEDRQELARVYLSLGRLLQNAGRPGEAKKAYLQAIHAGQKLVEFSPKADLRHDLARSHHCLGVLLSATGPAGETEAAFRAALGLLQDLVAKHPDSADFIQSLAVVHYDLGCELRARNRQGEAAREFREAIRLRPDHAEAFTNLGNILVDLGDPDGAIDAYRKALKARHKFAEAYKAHNGLGNALLKKGRRGDAVAAYRQAIALKKDFALAHYGLGNALFADQVEAAAEAYREAIRNDEAYPQAHVNLGNCYARLGRVPDAVAEYRRAAVLAPGLLEAHLNLGRALRLTGDLDGAVAEYRAVIRINAEYAEAYCHLGQALQQQGEFRKALRELRRGDELGSRKPGWRLPSAAWVRQCARQVDLADHLSEFLDGKRKPADADEGLELAGVCHIQRRYRAAVRFYRAAFRAKPALTENLGNELRYNAACAAALAGCGQGQDACRRDDPEAAGLRRQALAWLRDDLKVWGQLLEKGPAGVRPVVAGQMRHWQEDIDFAGVRGAKALAQVPEAERPLWQKLWADVAELLARAQAPTKEKTPGAK